MTNITKEIKRRTTVPFLHYQKPVIIELVPGDVIRLRLLKQRVSSSVSIKVQDLYYELLRRQAALTRAERRKQRLKARRRARSGG
jgi:hypothetical protein